MDERELRDLLLRVSEEAAETRFSVGEDLARGRAARARRRAVAAATGAVALVVGVVLALGQGGGPARTRPVLPGATSSAGPTSSAAMPGPVGETLDWGGYVGTPRGTACSGSWFAYDPDGTRAAATCDAGTYLSRLDGQAPQRVAAAGVGVAWTHDGSRLVVNHGRTLEVLEPDGPGSEPLVVPLPKSWLTMDLDLDASDRAVMAASLGNASAVVTIGLDGSRPVVLTRREDVELYSPRWSPDGSRVGYVQRQGKPFVARDRPVSLWTVARDGSDARRVAAYGVAYFAGGGFPGGFAWSRSGWMAFSTGTGPHFSVIVSPTGVVTRVQEGGGPLAWRRLSAGTQ